MRNLCQFIGKEFGREGYKYWEKEDALKTKLSDCSIHFGFTFSCPIKEMTSFSVSLKNCHKKPTEPDI